jgi:hypothetical protein
MSFDHMFYWCQFLDPYLTISHSNISLQVMVVLDSMPYDVTIKTKTRLIGMNGAKSIDLHMLGTTCCGSPHVIVN